MRSFFLILFVPFWFSCQQGQDETTESSVDEGMNVKQHEENTTEYGIIWNYEDHFSDSEKVKMETWIHEVYNATIQTLGQYPFDINVFFHRNNRNTAVTFGHTRRGAQQSVHFYVNPSFPIEDFEQDWIAPHEISHLSAPFVGKNAKWFSEGYATYLSRRIMINMGYFNDRQFDSLYYLRINGTLPAYSSETKTFQEVSDSLLDEYEYSDLYWGSTSFFVTSDSLLQIYHDMRFTDLVREYQLCCRMKDKNLDDLIHSYDAIISDTIFTHLLWGYRNLPGAEVMKGY